jgi:hypothetical protein
MCPEVVLVRKFVVLQYLYFVEFVVVLGDVRLG